jgi:hypothetical protein
VIYFTYVTLSSSSRYILVQMGMHWLECVIAIVGKVQWNTFVLSVTISHVAYFGTAALKYRVFCILNQIYLKALTTDVMATKLFWINSCTIQP